MALGLIPWQRSSTPARREENDPFSVLQREMNRLFRTFQGDLDIEPQTGALGGEWLPQIDVRSDGKEVLVTAELPGMTERDVEVMLNDNILTIRGEKREETEQKDKNYHRIERRYGTFERSIELPTPVQEDKVEASFKNGILTVKLPKAAEAQKDVKKIAIKKE